MGESEEDRLSFRKSLQELQPFSTPINFFIANENLKLQVPKLSADEALKIISDTKKLCLILWLW